MNQLLRALLDAADDNFPPVDGRITVLPPLAAPPESAAAGYEINAVVAFTGHAFIATSVDQTSLIAAGADGYGGASSPDVLRLIAGIASTSASTSQIGVLDATLVGSDNTSPYSFTLSNVPGGIYSVSARTVAVTGAQATSSPRWASRPSCP